MERSPCNSFNPSRDNPPSLQRLFRRRQGSALLHELSVGSRGQAVRFPEGAAECVQTLEAALLADLTHVELTRLQQLGRLAEPALTHVPPEAHPQSIAEN